MSVNDNMETGKVRTITVPSAANVASGDPIILGTNQSPTYNMAGVALESDPPTAARTATHRVSVAFKGVFIFTVVGKSGTGGTGTSKAIAPGDPVFASGGTYDATTGVTYGCTLCADSTHGYLFGYALDTVSGGATTTKCRVELQGGA